MTRPLVEGIHRLLEEGLAARPHPVFPGAVCGLDDGEETRVVHVGSAYRYADATGSPLPPGKERPIRPDTLFDLASLTKLFTATLVMRLVDAGTLALNDPIARFFDSYAAAGRDRVTIRQLLTHTSGLPAEVHFWRNPDPAARRGAVLRQPLEATPDTRSRYSCVGYLTLGFLAEHVLGQPLDVSVQEQVCVPLGLSDTSYRPLTQSPADQLDDLRSRIAATEMRRIEWTSLHDPDDPDPRGVVHDENAASLDGVAGNAGLFAPVRDVLTFGRAFLETLRTDEPTALGLSPTAVREMLSPQLSPAIESSYQSGLGFRIDDPSFMGGLRGSGQAYGHTGFTGTSIVMDADRDLVLVLLTNRVHPSRTWSELNPFRRRLADLVAGSDPTEH